MIGLVLSLAYMVPQDDLILIVKFCRGVDRDSWAWWYHMCWLYEAVPAPDAVVALASAGVALLSAKLLRWFHGAR